MSIINDIILMLPVVRFEEEGIVWMDRLDMSLKVHIIPWEPLAVVAIAVLVLVYFNIRYERKVSENKTQKG